MVDGCLVRKWWFPFLKIGVTWVDFQSCVHVSRDFTNSTDSGVHTCQAVSLKASSGQPLGPGDFLGLMSSNFLYTIS